MSDPRRSANMKKCPFIGTWSLHAGYNEDFRDTRLVFEHGGTGSIVSGGDSIPIQWEQTEQGRLTMVVYGKRWGPFDVAIHERDLPKGRFTVMESEGAILPFGLKSFAKISD